MACDGDSKTIKDEIMLKILDLTKSFNALETPKKRMITVEVSAESHQVSAYYILLRQIKSANAKEKKQEKEKILDYEQAGFTASVSNEVSLQIEHQSVISTNYDSQQTWDSDLISNSCLDFSKK